MKIEAEVSPEPGSFPDDSITEDDTAIDRLATGAGISLVGVGIGRGLDFAKQIAMARLLGPEAFGLYAIGWNFLRIVGILLPLGLHNGVVHFATAQWQKNDGAFKSILVRSVSISFIVSWVITGVLYILSPWITTALFKEPEFLPLFRLFLFMLPFMAALQVAAQASRISQRMQYAIASEEITQASVNLVLFFIFYLIGWQLFGAILATDSVVCNCIRRSPVLSLPSLRRISTCSVRYHCFKSRDALLFSPNSPVRHVWCHREPCGQTIFRLLLARSRCQCVSGICTVVRHNGDRFECF
ncbi:MAG: oligosaccharide flippase family protein [Chloroflexota bacterium]